MPDFANARPRRMPEWLKKPISTGGGEVRKLLAELGLATVCASAKCPNQGECFARHTATFLILGEQCTRNCRFCAVGHGRPAAPREDEPEAVATAAARLGLRHVVITSVTRDDLPDGGAGHFSRIIAAVRARLPQAIIEVLTPDFEGRDDAIDAVLAARPDIFNHNIETVPRLYPHVRPQADYARSLAVLARAAAPSPGPCGPTSPVKGEVKNQGEVKMVHVKSGIMVGLGETADEVLAVFADLRPAGCEILTVGQYLRPSADHLPVAEFVTPEQFQAYERQAREMGFLAVACGPFVRSSYQAEQVFGQM